MIPIHDLLNKIKWDKNEDPELYKIYYLDRVANKLKEIKFKNIKEISHNFMTVQQTEDEEAEIPLHRVREVRKGEKIVWKRHQN